MNQILDSDLSSNQLAELVERYIHSKRERILIETKLFRNELYALGFSKDQADELLIEMDDDADKELLAGIGVKKAKFRLVIGLSTGILGIVLCIFVAQIGVSLGIFFVPFGIIAASFLTAGKAYAEIGLVEKRKKRRLLKYQKWR